MNTLEKSHIVRYHRARMGMSPVQSLGWRSEATQIDRFAALCGWGDLSGASILDLGCGFGDLKIFLDEHFIDVHYQGIDLVPEFILQAKARFRQHPHTEFRTGDFFSHPLPLVDVVMASGSLNYRCSNTKHPYDSIVRMWDSARKGVAFNLLDARAQVSSGILQSHHPEQILEFCSHLDPEAKLISGYHPEDFTILMHRSPLD